MKKPIPEAIRMATFLENSGSFYLDVAKKLRALYENEARAWARIDALEHQLDELRKEAKRKVRVKKNGV